MSITVNVRGEGRKLFMDYFEATKKEKEWKDARAKLKAACIKLFLEAGQDWKAQGSTDYMYTTVQVQGKAKPVAYKVTTKKVSTDWKGFVQSLGYTEEQVWEWQKEQLAKAEKPTTSISEEICWATANQCKELGL